MKSARLFVNSKDFIWHGAVNTHVDDFLYGGDEVFMKYIDKARSDFKCGNGDEDYFKYTGLKIQTIDDARPGAEGLFAITIDQTECTNNIEPIEITDPY